MTVTREDNARAILSRVPVWPQRGVCDIPENVSEESRMFLMWDNAQNMRLDAEDQAFHEGKSDEELWVMVDPNWDGRHMAPSGMVARAAHELRRRGLV